MALGACTTSRTRELHLPVSGHGFRIHAALAALAEALTTWRELWRIRSLADSSVRMRFIAAANDIRPDWPLRQLAELVPAGSFELVAGVDHNFWTTDPERWIEVVTEACTQL